MKTLLESKIVSARVYPEFFPITSEERVLNVGCGVGPQAVIYRGSFKEMIGVDINKERLDWSAKALPEYGVTNYRTVHAKVESISLPAAGFDKVIAVDVIEHVQNPAAAIREIYRLLKSGGRLLITFPAMHDRYTDAANAIRKFFSKPLKLANCSNSNWNPDAHNQKLAVADWIQLARSEGFQLIRSRATTMFPPLHYWGIAKFWFLNDVIHGVDKFFCQLPIIKNFGLTLMVIFQKPAANGSSPVRKSKLPIFELKLDEAEIEAVGAVMRSGQISRGDFPEKFERALARYLAVRHCVVFSSGTAALHAAMAALQLPADSEVIVPSLTFVATVFAPVYENLKPVFADICPNTLCLDPEDVRRKITSRTRAIITMDYAGQPSDLLKLKSIAQENGCYLIEDAAHSVGANYNGEKVGGIADLTAFSFFASKNMTGGEGGAVTTNDSQLADRLRLFKAHGISYPKNQPRVSGCYDVVSRGYNFYLSNLNIALAMAQLAKLDERNKKRKTLAKKLGELIKTLDTDRLIQLPAVIGDHVFHLYTVLIEIDRLKKDRDALIRAILAEGVETGVYYKPAHLFSYFKNNRQIGAGQLPVTEWAADRLITLPMHPELTDNDLKDIARALRKVVYAYRKNGK